MPTSPTAPSAVPDFPAIGDASYNSKAFAWATHMDATYPTEMQALATNAYGNAVEAGTSATTATTQAGLASGFATTASGHATTATTQAGIATTQAGNAATSAAAAAASAATASSAVAFVDSNAVVKGSADATKLLRFEVDGFTTATTRVITPLNEDMTLVGVSNTQTLTAKTLTSPTITAATLTGFTETVYSLSGTTPAFSEANGSIQTWTLSGASTPTDSLTTGQSIILVITPGAYSITWPTLTWTKVGGSGAAPTLYSAGKTTVILWKIGSTLYGSHLGDM